jgi:phosphate starvation-inducible PhoH-like protein
MTAVTLSREFEDNALSRALFGPHNVNLERVGRLLGTTLDSRGTAVTIKGERLAAEATQAALEALYERIKRGDSLEASDIDAAVRLAEGGEHSADDLTVRTRRRHIAPRTPVQADYIRVMRSLELVFALGPAGTGKTYLAVAKAVSMMLKGKVDRLILSRPAVEAGEKLGYLPGDMKEKIDPYLRPLYDALYDMLPAEQVAKKLASGEIEVAPLAFMRGRTLANSFIILDEAQNTTPMQMKMFLTRLGENSRMVVAGDPSQVDLPGGTRSGLAEACRILDDVPGIGFIRFTDRDVVRHDLVTRIVRAYDSKTKPADG